jgi:PPOX class probable F420-dependent enzyme
MRRQYAESMAQAHDHVPDTHRDLLESPVATLATLSEDGPPQLSEVWFLAEGDRIALSLNGTRQKTKNLQRRPECTLFILDLANPVRYLEIRARAQLVPDADYVFAARFGAKYGADLRGRDAPGEQRYEVRLDPVRINAVDLRG